MTAHSLTQKGTYSLAGDSGISLDVTVRQFRFRAAHCFLLLAFLAAPMGFAAEENPFAEIIRKSPPLTPAQEQKTFHLPPGFQIQLVASEPAIGKPMNIAFDAQGRLWLTQSREYPFAAPTNRPARDKIMVLSDFAPNGMAQKVTTFAEGLNVPIGIYPYKNGCLAFSIPNIYFYEDTDGDGRSDRRTKVLGEFGYTKDLHGLTSNFRRGFDGWVYAEHGFKNDSTLTASDGSQITMNSGNSYRFRPDGSHVEHYSFGQVNPFGLMFDPLGDLWGSDCHSLPVYLLLREAYYPSFGKPNDGLGFAPSICDHSHGSTAIAGMVFYAATNFPPQFRNNTYIGNVMTCRINRDSFAETGSTRVAREEPDFLSCDDPWFRPVALELGPDGAMYMADFYNRIIGHYEVPLDNPGRDRERGRIWRISYTGKAAAAPAEPLAMPRDAAALVAELGNPNIGRRMLAMSEITDRIGKPAVGLLENVFQNPSANAFQKAHALWTLERLGALNENLLVREARDPSRDVRVHVMRIVGELASPTPAEMALAVTGATDSDAYVQRAAADALGRHPAFENIAALLKLRGTIPDADPELLHVTRIALRDNLAASNNFSRVIASDTAEADSRFIADVSVGIQTGDAAEFLMKHIQKFSEDRHHIEEYLQHVARFAPESRLGDLADFTRRKFAADLDFQVALFKSTGQGLAQRGVAMNEALTNWGAMLAEKMIAELDPDSFAWRNSSLKGGNAPNPWFVEAWPSADGNTTAPFLSSRDEGGGNATGILRSKPFVIPRQLSFYIAGYDGTPDRPIGKRSFFYLRSAKDDKILARARPPVKDIAQRVTWRLDRFAGQKGYLEIVDGNRGHTAAWLAVGRLDPAVVPMPSSIPSDLQKRQLLAAELAEQLRLTSLGPALAGLLRDQNRGEDLRMASAKALAAAEGESSVPELADVFSNSRNPEPLREGVAFLLAKINDAHARSVLSAGLAAAPFAAQRKIAAAMAANPQGAEALLETVERGKVSARVLRDNQVKERLEASLGGSAGTEASIRPVAIKNQPSSLDARLAKLTKDLEPISAEKQKLIDSRYQGFLSGHGSASRGAAVFNHNCSVCHSINSRGGNIGPQLDGVGNRGAARLAEDILDPNRNVDPAFFYSNVTLKDDTVVTGLFRREEGALLVFANSSGKEVSVPKSEITDQRVSKHSLMPDNFGDLISQSDFNDLVTFLLTKQRK